MTRDLLFKTLIEIVCSFGLKLLYALLAFIVGLKLVK